MNKLTLNHLYSKSLNIYGDLGNVIALKHLCRKLGVDLEVFSTEIGDKFIKADIYFVGGGQDKDQMLVYEDLIKHKTTLQKEFESGKVFLLVCGGFQLFGDFFVDGQGNKIPGLGILNMETKALDDKVSSRSIGNLVVQMSDEFVTHWGIDESFSKYLVGFENHGGQSYLNSKIKMQNEKLNPIGNVVFGRGNNATEKIEGAWIKNLIGCYMHGSLLPKNPHLGMALINKALIVRHSGKPAVSGAHPESPNVCALEKKAHEEILKRLGIRN